MRTPIALALFLVLGAGSLTAGESLKVYGRGTPGSGGHTPDIWSSVTPRPGASNFAVTVDRALGGAGALAILSPAPASIPLAGLQLNVSLLQSVVAGPVVLGGSGPGKGSGSFPMPIPNLSVLVGSKLYAQAFVLDAGGAPVGLAGTPGLEIRPALGGLLVVPTSVGGSADPQYAVDLGTGQVRTCTGAVNNGQVAVFTRGGTHFMIPGSLSRSLDTFDATVWPPKKIKSYTVSGNNGHPWSVAITPDGMRAYLVNEGPANTPCNIEVLWAVPGMPNYMQPFPGGPVSLGNVGDALNLVFNGDGTTGYLAVLGLISGGGRVEILDTRVGSPGYNKIRSTIRFPGKYVWGVDISPDRSRVFAIVGAFGGSFSIAVLDTATEKLIDFDPAVPGVQNLGGELVAPRTAIEKQVTFIKAGPRGRYLYLSNFHSFSRLAVDPKDPNYKQVVTIKGPALNQKYTYGIAVTDAGDRAYVGLHSAASVVEVDTATMTLKRTFAVGNNPTFPGIR